MSEVATYFDDPHVPTPPTSKDSGEDDIRYPVAHCIGLAVRGTCVIVPAFVVCFLFCAGIILAILAVVVGYVCHKIDEACEWPQDRAITAICQWLLAILWGIVGSSRE